MQPDTKKYYTEEELIEMLQNNEIKWVEFINLQSETIRNEYELYCFRHSLNEKKEASAIEFIKMKEMDFDIAIEDDVNESWL